MAETTKAKTLTRKQQAFVKELIDNPKQSATKAALNTYNTTDYRTAQMIASENLSKPIIKTELAKYSNEVENTLYRAVTDWGTHERPRQREIALDAAKYIHDKIHGRATQKVETHSEAVIIHVDLTSSEPV